MRVPAHMTLREWILDLMEERRLYRFYKTDDWLTLRDEVMRDHHYECVRCEEKGEYSPADTVHHEYEVKKFPHMALTRWVTDPLTGEEREVLHPLCNQCHNDVHGRTRKGSPPRERAKNLSGECF